MASVGSVVVGAAVLVMESVDGMSLQPTSMARISDNVSNVKDWLSMTYSFGLLYTLLNAIEMPDILVNSKHDGDNKQNTH